MKHIVRILVFIFVFVTAVQAQPQRIDNFIVKEKLTQNGKLAIIALDSAEQPMEHINGTFIFNLNGFQQDLRFHDGVGVVQDPLESSTFVFFKHKNQINTVSKFYYIHKKDNELKPFKINGLLLLFIPVAVLLIAYLFKRFLATFVVMALVYAYFHYSKGLDLSTMLESILDALKSLI